MINYLDKRGERECKLLKNIEIRKKAIDIALAEKKKKKEEEKQREEEEKIKREKKEIKKEKKKEAISSTQIRRSARLSQK